MCLSVYLASDHELPEVPWDEERPAFHLVPVDASHLVRERFTHRHVYAIGSHFLCGCGFQKPYPHEVMSAEQIEDAALCERNYDDLARCVERALRRGAKLELFTCWAGSEDREPYVITELAVEALADPGFAVRELELLRLGAAG